jgi:hypothetical protein
MDKLTLTSKVLGLAIGAGLNLYAALLVIGLGIRYGWLHSVPGEMVVLAHPVVLIAAAAMYLAEFVADKVPFFTPIWDGIHTFIRPVGAALLALGATVEMDPLARVLAVIGAGTVALGTHTSKMGFRLMAHTTPEPASHSVISVAEDFGVVGLVLLAYQYPRFALPLFLCIVLAIAMFLPLLLRIARFLLAGVFGRVASWLSIEATAEMPGRVRVFARTVKGAPRLKPGWLRPETGEFRYYYWGRSRDVRLGPVKEDLEWGFFFNVARTTEGASFYLTKQWCSSMKRAHPVRKLA